MNTATTTAFAAALLFAAATASAQTPAPTPFSHPAVVGTAFTGEQQADLVNPALIGHPSSPTWAIVHSNGEHPADTQARLHGAAVFDSNTFIVQPPASVRWTLHSDENLSVAQAGR